MDTSKLQHFRLQNNYDTDIASFKSGLDCSSSLDRTQQNFKNECDINTLVKTFGATGIIPGADLPPTSFEFDEVFDFQSAQNTVIEAQRAFMQFPADTRKLFDNDPQQLLAFVADESNRDRAVELGLIPKPIPQPPQTAPVASPPQDD